MFGNWPGHSTFREKQALEADWPSNVFYASRSTKPRLIAAGRNKFPWPWTRTESLRGALRLGISCRNSICNYMYPATTM